MAVSQDSAHTLYHATHLHARFLALLPKIELHGQIFFRYLKCLHSRQEAIAEMVALAWKWVVRLAERGKDACQFVSALATFAARAVYSGRRVCGMDPGKDVLSLRAQKRHHFTTGTLREGKNWDG